MRAINTAINFWRIFRKESLSVRLHVFGRVMVCPFFDLVPYFPKTGYILDIGCGHGLLLYLLNKDISNKGRQLLGVDHDADKINAVKAIGDADMKFSGESLESLPNGKFDAVSMVDVLYSVNLNKWKALLDNCFRLLKPGGRLIIKDVINKPRWKYWVTMFEEKLAIEVFKITQGDKPHIESLETCLNALMDSGFIISEAKPLNKWHWISQYMFIADKKL